MGKKLLRQASPKVSKDQVKTMKKQQFNSLVIQVLRLKVYITDSPTFKTLVQELTGNGSSSSSPTTHDPDTVLVDDRGHVGDPEIRSSCMEAFSDTSLDSFKPSNNNYSYTVSSSSSEEKLFKKYDATACNEIFLEDTTTTSVEYLSMSHHQLQQAEFLEYQQDLESWLLDMDSAYSSCNVSAHHQIQQEVTIDDYEIYGLI